MKTYIRRQQHKKFFKHQDIKQKEPLQKYRLGTVTGGIKPVLQVPNLNLKVCHFVYVYASDVGTLKTKFKVLAVHHLFIKILIIYYLIKTLQLSNNVQVTDNVQLKVHVHVSTLKTFMPCLLMYEVESFLLAD